MTLYVSLVQEPCTVGKLWTWQSLGLTDSTLHSSSLFPSEELWLPQSVSVQPLLKSPFSHTPLMTHLVYSNPSSLLRPPSPGPVQAVPCPLVCGDSPPCPPLSLLPLLCHFSSLSRRSIFIGNIHTRYSFPCLLQDSWLFWMASIPTGFHQMAIVLLAVNPRAYSSTPL